MRPTPKKKPLLTELADMNERIISDAPATLREACQWIIWFHLASRTYNRDGAGGQDRLALRPFYEQDKGKRDPRR